MKIVTLLSGGMDSSTLLFYLLKSHKGAKITALGFNYGQRHRERELAAASNVAFVANHRYPGQVQFAVINLESLTGLLTGSALTDSTVDVPEGHYADETMKATVVPNRNMMMLSIAGAVAVSQKAELLAFGAHAGDHPIYPDCRPVFVDLVNTTLRIANEGFGHPDLIVSAPFVGMSKTEIAVVGTNYAGVPFDLTWSCYKGGKKHCGACSTCGERREAFRDAGIVDLTEYEKSDREFWPWWESLGRAKAEN